MSRYLIVDSRDIQEYTSGAYIMNLTGQLKQKKHDVTLFLVENGVLVVTEKVLTNNSHMNRFFIDFYYDYKKRNRYSSGEIQRKREALENVLIPYRIDENLDLFRRNGFEIVEMFFQWYNFAGFLCMKTPASARRR